MGDIERSNPKPYMKKLTGKQKAYQFLLTRGTQGITSVQLAEMFNGRTLTARFDDLAHEKKVTRTPITIQGIRRTLYRLSQFEPTYVNTVPSTEKKITGYFDNERNCFVYQ